MALSRYANNKIVDNFYYGSWRNKLIEGKIEPNILNGLTLVEHIVSQNERLDHLAARYLGDDQYYWVIAIVNSIIDPLDIQPGQKLMVPTNVREVIERLM